MIAAEKALRINLFISRVQENLNKAKEDLSIARSFALSDLVVVEEILSAMEYKLKNMSESLFGVMKIVGNECPDVADVNPMDSEGDE